MGEVAAAAAAAGDVVVSRSRSDSRSTMSAMALRCCVRGWRLCRRRWNGNAGDGLVGSVVAVVRVAAGGDWLGGDSVGAAAWVADCCSDEVG